MIIWLASYPKSGDELVRTLLSSYVFAQDGSYHSELLNNIKQFPSNELFKQLGVDINNEETMYKNYIRSQKLYSDEKAIRFLKTHSSFVNRKDFQFTDKHNTLGVIYIVRDPRNVITSLNNHFHHENIEQSKKFLFDERKGTFNKSKYFTNENFALPQVIGSCRTHYKSWKLLKKNYLLIKYENLVLIQ